MPLSDLQDVLDASLRDANALTRSLFADDSWDAHQVTEFVNRIGNITVATVSKAGRPHAATAIAAMTDGSLYFTASNGSATLANIERDPHIAFSITDPAHGVVGRATARRQLRRCRPEALLRR